VDKLWRACTVEFIITFTLIFIGAGAGVMASADVGGSGLVGVALAHGIALAVLVSISGHISGGHVNPAVTIGLWVTGRVASARAGAYIVAQMAGAVLGALMLSLVIPRAIWEAAGLGAPAVNTSIGVGVGQAVLLEAVLTFFLVFAVYGTAVDPRGAFGKVAGFSIGLVLTFDILVGGNLSGAAMNPARWFGPALIAGDFTNWWVWIVGPIAGGIAAGVVYFQVFLKGNDAVALEPVQP